MDIQNEQSVKRKKSFLQKESGLIWRSKPFLYSAGAVLLLALPLLVSNSYTLHILILSLLFAVLALSWNLLVGYAGIFSFGHHAFFGLGAYVSALVSMKLGISPWLGLVLGGLAAALAGLIVSLPVLRLRAAPYIAIVTLAFAEIIKLVASNLVDLTRGELGLNGIESFDKIGPISFTLAHRESSYYLILLIMLMTVFIISTIMKGPIGFALKAIRESQDAAESLGVNVTRYKLFAFVVSSCLAGVAGSFYAHYIHTLTPTSVMNIDVMMQILVITLIGGLGTIIGPIVGSMVLVIGLEYMRFLGDYRMMIYGALLVVVIVFLPEGFMRKLFPKAKDL
ncbi:branched-chain amino acid ABC transporter permease [Brevibacillus sp. B_LB10_24]|uniref:branched-chain amino acid ABC transporter permease n=1 Tax=Brevibacillus sp. B_LB10_24 TaxID=3380645 RepID=UPI0038BC27D9